MRRQKRGHIVPENKRSISAIHGEGMDARGGGRPLSACPYPEGSQARQAWTKGWNERGDLEDSHGAHTERFVPREA